MRFRDELPLRSWVAAVFVVVTLATCARTAPLPPPAQDLARESPTAGISTICVYPVAADEAIGNSSRVDRIDDRIVSELGRASFRAVRIVDDEGLWSQLVAESGGFYDRDTGRTDAAARERVVARYRADLATRHGCDAFLRPSIHVVSAPFEGSKAKWDGAERSLDEDAGSLRGWVAALSLWVDVEDSDGRHRYFGTGGISLTKTMMRKAGGAIGFEDLPLSSLLGDPDRNDAAVDLALCSLLSDDCDVGPSAAPTISRSPGRTRRR